MFITNKFDRLTALDLNLLALDSIAAPFSLEEVRFDVPINMNGDDYADDITTTGVLPVDGSVSGSIDFFRDNDWFAITLSANEAVNITVSQLQSLEYSIYDNSGNFVRNSRGGDTLHITSYTPDTYFISVGQFGDPEGAYTLTSITTTPDLADNVSTLGSLTVGGSVSSLFEYGDRDDWFAIDLTAGQIITFTASRVLSYMSMYDSAGVSLSGAFGSSDTFTFEADDTGRYYLSAESSGHQELAYSIVAREIFDDYEDDVSTTGSLQVNGTITGSYDYARDSDWFAITLTEGQIIDFRIDVGTRIMEVFDENGLRLDSVFGPRSLEFVALDDATYFISVTANTNPAGNYTLSALEVIDDYAADISTTGFLTYGGTVMGNHDYREDRDWFEISLTAGEPVRFASNQFLSEMTLFDSTGALLAEEPTSDPFDFFPSVSGTYYIEIYAIGRRKGPYTLSAEILDDDFAGNATTTGVLTLDGPSVSANIQFSGDKDWFAVEAVAGQVLEFSFESTDFTQMYLELLTANGQRLANNSGQTTFTYTVEADGVYYLSAIDTIGASSGSYAVSVITLPDMNGTNGDDVLNGTIDDDVINGLAGDDIINGLDGDDILHGGEGMDTLNGGTDGDDFLYGGAGDDLFILEAHIEGFDRVTIDGGDGIDTLSFLTFGTGISVTDFNGTVNFSDQGPNDENLLGEAVNVEDFIGTAFGDFFYIFSDHAHMLDAGNGDDQIRFEGLSDDIINAGGGDDFIKGGQGIDVYDGGAGIDQVSYFYADDSDRDIFSVDLRINQILNDSYGNAETIINVETVSGGSVLDDLFHGDDEDNGLYGNIGGADSLFGHGGDDILFLAEAGGTIDGGAGFDKLYFTSARYIDPDVDFDGSYEQQYRDQGLNIDLQSGLILDDGYGGTGTVTNVEGLVGTNFDDIFIGGIADEEFFGLFGSDVISGGDGDDLINGGRGIDNLDGGAGNDTVSVLGEITGNIVNLASGMSSAVTTTLEMSPAATTQSVFDAADFNRDGYISIVSKSYTDGELSGEIQNKNSDTTDSGTGIRTVEFALRFWATYFNSQFVDTSAQGQGTLTFFINSSGDVTYSVDISITGIAPSTITAVHLREGNRFEDTPIANDILADGGVISSELNTDTIANFENVNGSSFDDTITGDTGANQLFGDSGDDIVNGGSGDDIVIGGEGMDTLDGGTGIDLLSYKFDQSGRTFFLSDFALSDGLFEGDTFVNFEGLEGTNSDDVFNGTNNIDIISGAAGDDAIRAGSNNDTAYGGDGADTILGNSGDDVLSGGADDDLIIGGGGNDTVNGDDGNDSLSGQGSDDILNGGLGDDFILGGSGADTISGGDGVDDINAGGGNDTVNGDAGNDVINAGGGADMVMGGDGDDALFGNNQNDTIFGELGVDTISGGAGNDTLDGGEGNDIISGDGSKDTLFGDDGDDMLFGGSGGDALDGGSGADTLEGGGGNDILTGGIGADVFVQASGFRADRITDFEDGIDLIDFSGNTTVNDFAKVMNSAFQQGTTVRIELNPNNILVLENFDLADLDASDFIF